MKQFIILVLLFVYGISSAQSTRNVHKVVTLHEEHNFYLNSKMRLGGKTRNSIKIDLPKNTIQWYYVFTTTLNETETNNTKKNIKLTTQLAKLLTNVAVNSNIIDLSSSAAFQVIKPTGASVIDVYLTDHNGYNHFHEKDILGMWTYSNPGSYKEGSRENARDGIVSINDLKRGTAYLCFKNPSPLEGILVTLEVSAIVLEEEYVDVWTNESKEDLSTLCMQDFYNKDAAARQVCNCFVDKITGAYTPSSFHKKTKDQKGQYAKESINNCFDETGNSGIKNVSNRLRELNEEITGLIHIKDYENLILKYEEVLSLGVENDDIYNSLGWFCILTKKFDQAKGYLTKGLSKNPSNLYLQGNLAHYFLLTDNYHNAEEIYLRYKKEKMQKKVRWEDAISDDFVLFEQLGINCPDYDKIRKLLKIKKG